MADPRPQYVANIIVQEIRNENYLNLRDIAHDILSRHHIFQSDEMIWDYVEHYIEDISKELFIKESNALESGLTIPFDIDQDGEDYYIKYRSVPYTSVLDALWGITPKQFEHFCADLINKMGGRGIVNGGSIDEGVDFIGENILFSGINKNAFMPNNIYLIGQAKHYCDGHNVTLNEGRSFLGSAMKYRDKMIRSSRKLFQPFIFAYWTTSDFHSETLDLFNSMGVWALNGQQLSALAFNMGYSKEMIESLPNE